TYTATVNVTVTGPLKEKITSIKRKSGSQVYLKWQKQAGVTGYKVYYRKSGSGKYKAISTTRNAKQNTYTFKGLKKKTTYQFKVRSFITVNGKTYYGPYSAVRKIKTK
ncbi:MAG: fibronectin type III domain-containing protein, partial [Eubacteriales bacterium]|nr:fibronectin type III domain-containing protein [Eubacteriales bacterium]